jgi:heat shock protein HtpX
MKRVVLFLLTNIAVMLVLSISARILGIDRFLTSNGLNMGMLLAFAALIGFGGSFISLMMSKTMAKWSTGAQVIQRPGNQDEAWLVTPWDGWQAKPDCRCPRSPSTKALPMPLPPGPASPIRWWPSRPDCCKA